MISQSSCFKQRFLLKQGKLYLFISLQSCRISFFLQYPKPFITYSVYNDDILQSQIASLKEHLAALQK